MASIAIAGTDDWLRAPLHRRLASMWSVTDVGPGSSYFRGVDTLVLVPVLAPRSTSPERDVGARSALVTMTGAVASHVDRVVMVSRVGAGVATDEYSAALDDLERYANANFKRVTSVRLTHPFGDRDDPGPVVAAMLRLGLARVVQVAGDTEVQPIYRDDAVEVVAAAVEGRFGAGMVEAGGPEVMTLAQFGDAVDLLYGGRAIVPGEAGGLLRRGRRSDDAIVDFLAATSCSSGPAHHRRALADVWELSPRHATDAV